MTSELNRLMVKEYPAIPDSKILAYPLLEEDPKTGDLIIPLYDLNGQPCRYYRDNVGKTINGHERNLEIRRYHPDNYQRLCEKADRDEKDHPGKYQMPKGAKTLPWIAPSIIKAVAEKTPIDTIYIIEGYIKAIAGWINGLDIFGISGILNARDKDAGTLHPAILDTIRICGVKNVVLVYDGDCRQISLNALNKGKDLRQRPYQFFNSAQLINEMLKDQRKEKEFDVYFAHVNSENLAESFDKATKGLDDLFAAFPDDKKEIVKELSSFSKKASKYFQRFNITAGLQKVFHHLNITTAESFYIAHNQIIKEKEFIFGGTKYKWDPEKKELKTVVPGAASFYFRVGDEYFKKIWVPNEIGKLEYRFQKRAKSTIIDDHGKELIAHIPKYESFCVMPDHVNYQEVINGCYNRYKPLEQLPSEDPECPKILNFLQHIFKHSSYDLGLDYIQILYQKPIEKLPILCLVSKENKTGKSTFNELLKAIFTGNMTIIGNDQLESNFNALWADKLVIACEESFIDKMKTVEKLKALSTGKRVPMERKGVDADEMAFFGKFILNSNKETNFILAAEEDERYWVVRVEAAAESNPNLLDEMIEEIPNFLCFLNKRHLSVSKKEDRMWFKFNRIRTDAFDKLVAANKSGPVKEMTTVLRTMFLDTGFYKLQFTLKYIEERIFRKKYDRNYITHILHDKFKATTGTSERIVVPEISEEYVQGIREEKITAALLHGRAYTFWAHDFLTKDELAEFKLSELAQRYGQLTDVPAEIAERSVIQKKQTELVPTYQSETNDDLPF